MEAMRVARSLEHTWDKKEPGGAGSGEKCAVQNRFREWERLEHVYKSTGRKQLRERLKRQEERDD